MRETPRTECGLCQTEVAPTDIVRGRKRAICRRCVEAGIVWVLRSSATARDGQTAPRAYAACSVCEDATPPAALFSPTEKGEPSVCATCLHEAYNSLTQLIELANRRHAHYPRGRGDLVATMLAHHFEDLEVTDIVTATRTFAAYLRADLQRALDQLWAADEAEVYGFHANHVYETLTFAKLLQEERDGVKLAPLQYEDIDVGDAEPRRCMRGALWLVEREGIRHAVLMTRAHQHGETRGWQVEIAVPAGDVGQRVARKYFRELELAVEQSASYRGKVLSLECQASYRGTAVGNIVVHKLAPVERDEIILPRQTVELLEHNVFRFVEHRQRLIDLGMPVKKGLLFYGPPGTGKTHTIRWLAGALRGHTTLLISAEQVGALAEYMMLARLLSPAIVVIEDVDLIAREREDMQTAVQESLLNRLLNEMDGLRENSEVLFLLTTNHPEALEKALAGRPGRVDQAVEFPLPDDDGRRRLLDLYRRGLEIDAEVATDVVRRTHGVSASFIKELMRRTAQCAFERDPGTANAVAADIDRALAELLFEGGTLNAKLLGARVAEG